MSDITIPVDKIRAKIKQVVRYVGIFLIVVATLWVAYRLMTTDWQLVWTIIGEDILAMLNHLWKLFVLFVDAVGGFIVSLLVIWALVSIKPLRRITFPALDELILSTQLWRASKGFPVELDVLKWLGMSEADFLGQYKNYKFELGEGLLMVAYAILTAITALAIFMLIGNFGTPAG